MADETTNQAQEQKKEKITGIFSSQTIQKVGTGTTTRKTVKKAFWSVDELDEGDIIEIQPLNINYIPSGPKKKIPKEEFLEKYSPEPEFYFSTVYPKMKEMDEAVKKGDEHRENGDNFSAELEYGQALEFDEENVRANFGLGLTYLERGDDTKANDIFERLLKLEAAFQEEHKHLFNDFGINLRKNKMLDQSIEYYERALELTASDENLYYNLARVLYEQKEYEKTAQYLHKALKMNSSLQEARQFLDFLVQKGLIDDGDVGIHVVEEGEDSAASSADAS